LATGATAQTSPSPITRQVKRKMLSEGSHLMDLIVTSGVHSVASSTKPSLTDWLKIMCAEMSRMNSRLDSNLARLENTTTKLDLDPSSKTKAENLTIKDAQFEQHCPKDVRMVPETINSIDERPRTMEVTSDLLMTQTTDEGLPCTSASNWEPAVLLPVPMDIGNGKTEYSIYKDSLKFDTSEIVYPEKVIKPLDTTIQGISPLTQELNVSEVTLPRAYASYPPSAGHLLQVKRNCAGPRMFLSSPTKPPEANKIMIDLPILVQAINRFSVVKSDPVKSSNLKLGTIACILTLVTLSGDREKFQWEPVRQKTGWAVVDPFVSTFQGCHKHVKWKTTQSLMLHFSPYQNYDHRSVQRLDIMPYLIATMKSFSPSTVKLCFAVKTFRQETTNFWTH
jgi:hypothetical protein